MALKDALLPEFDQEMAITRRCLERVPFTKAEWKPHPKSFTMGWLATFTALLAGWGTSTLKEDSFDIDPAGGPTQMPAVPTTTPELLSGFDKGVAECRAELAKATDQQLMQPWSLKKRGQIVFTLPRIAVFRSMVLSHMIHHRGQLTVYLRMCDIPVPSTYGPSGDDKGWG